MEQETIIIVSVLGAAWAVLLIITLVLWSQVAKLRRVVAEMQATGRIRVQKLKINSDKNHAFHNPALSPEEELSRRGYSMYQHDDVEADPHEHRERERQTGGDFIEDLTRELESRQQRPTTAPPFLLQSIEENKRKTRSMNPMANGRQSETNPNFIY
ncbi:uncharacterized protein LOC128672004 [Plodia interpunctella]|uniref:uncharacterized protein LOC128672004 n=1 Tax=Plodia interpunctella TaxID=58824 RepID=UPI002368EB0E|nr:uncharacterized protein LOC128672004 [Plodia interpunctella]